MASTGLLRQCLPWSPKLTSKHAYCQREGETADDTRARCQRRVAELAEELEMLKEVLACSEIENVERIAAQLHDAKREADKAASEAAAAVAAAQEAAERVTVLAADLEHAKAEADSFALIAELEAAKEDADSAAAYWSEPIDTEDCRIHCEGGTSDSSVAIALLQDHNSSSQENSCTISSGRLREEISTAVKQPMTSTLEPLQAKPDSETQQYGNSKSQGCAGIRSSDGGAGCYLVFEEHNQGTLTATWSKILPT